ncbi:MAG: hypothetical protein EXS35_03515 [Pedosphaera sp.]|nr:hypothetical protein [Pedosphaera sp.]
MYLLCTFKIFTSYSSFNGSDPDASPYSVTVSSGAGVVASTSLNASHFPNWVSHSMQLSLNPGSYTLVFQSTGPAFGLATLLDNVSLPSQVLDFYVYIPSQFANETPDGDLSFCSDDLIRCQVITTVPAGYSVIWMIDPSDTSPSSETYFVASPNSGVGSSFDFNLASLIGWPNYAPTEAGRHYEPRPLLGFTVTATLVDGAGNIVGNPRAKTIQQSDLGQLRQEYVDFPVTGGVPDVSDFTGAHPELNFGDYPNWGLVTGWAVNAAAGVVADAGGGVPPITTSVSSCYRNPVHHANVYLLEVHKPVKWGSQHLYGAAVDFRVSDFNADGKDHKDYNLLKRFADNYGKVVPEGVVNHVHVQQK